MLSVANSCDYNEIPKIICTQMPAPRPTPINLHHGPGQKLGSKSPRVRANFGCKSPAVPGGDGYGKIDSRRIILPRSIKRARSTMQNAFNLFLYFRYFNSNLFSQFSKQNIIFFAYSLVRLNEPIG